jgi:cyanate permease
MQSRQKLKIILIELNFRQHMTDYAPILSTVTDREILVVMNYSRVILKDFD